MTDLLGGASPEVVVQRMVPPGVAVIVTVTEDPSFGAVVGFGVAGVATELLRDVAYRAVPLTDVDAHDLVRSPRAAPLLFGHRGADPVDVAALEDLLLRVGRLADDHPEVAALELNPVVVRRSGVDVLGARLQVAPSIGRPDTGPRRMRA
jgi:acyl-CoA synthetase (NDP forming)